MNPQQAMAAGVCNTDESLWVFGGKGCWALLINLFPTGEFVVEGLSWHQVWLMDALMVVVTLVSDVPLWSQVLEHSCG